jgi:aldose 1-epimerase
VNASEELVLRSDELEVVLLPALGGRIHRLRAFGHDLVRTPTTPDTHREEPFFWGAYVMAPWCNRIRPGPTEVEGRTVALEPNFDDGTAIHGQVSSRPWERTGEGALRVSGGEDGSGWPWAYDVTAQATVDGPTLRLRYQLANRSDGRMPAGIGLHPWFRTPVEIAFPAEAVYPRNSDSPAHAERAAGRLDLARPHPLAPDIDATWAGPREPRIELAWPDAGVSAALEVETPRLLVAAASPAHLDAVAVEPQTHGPDGLRRLLRHEPDALTVLGPGETLLLDLRLTVSPRTHLAAEERVWLDP